MSHLPFVLRDKTENDEALIYNSYLLSYKNNTDNRYVPNIIYYKHQAKILDYLLQNANTLVACFPEDPEEIMGWIIYENLTDNFMVHYIYIRGLHEGKGLATDIIKSLNPNNKQLIQTHLVGKVGPRGSIRYWKDFKIVFDPFYITEKRLLNENNH